MVRLEAAEAARVHIRVRGQVQGVGFRPFVYRVAGELGLSGWVRNDGAGVEIEAQGEPVRIEQLLRRLRREAPPLARVREVEAGAQTPREGGEGFRILPSRGGPAATGIAPDTALCADCLSELFDPADRRYRHPFINCTQCGPRYTITTALPYDRHHTSMACFPMCPRCREEYQSPQGRRFHAQPNACPECGPTLRLLDREGRPASAPDPLAAALDWLGQGKILAIKGLGGFHLACDARNGEAVARLRLRKAREEKPFAVMLAGLASLAGLVHLGPDEEALLESPERPVVLLPKGPDCDRALPGVAPGMPRLGVMLPYAPLHYLLFHQAAGRPDGTAWLAVPQPLALVMTSANPGGEPLVTGNREALARLAGIADGFLVHDRDIRVRCDDSVLYAAKGAPALVRRGRGFTPRAIRLTAEGPSVLACGGYLKNTVCLTRGDEAFLSQHIGDLDNAATRRALEETVEHLCRVLEIRPEAVAHDLHPDFFSTRFAADFAARHGVPILGVQHHHAHIAAVAAEHGLEGPLLGLALDGVGLGADGGIWGGELLRVEGARAARLGHLGHLTLPGGERAAREPWRMAAGALFALGRGAQIGARLARPGAEAVAAMLERGVNCPPTSSAGRLFDAAVGLLGVKEVQGFEGQGAMLLEGLAEARGPVAPLERGYLLEGNGVLSFLPLLDHLADLDDASYGAALFHATLADGLARWVAETAEREGLRRVALGGGCFLNRILRERLAELLGQRRIEVFQAHQVPPNDGGLSLGQAWVTLQDLV